MMQLALEAVDHSAIQPFWPFISFDSLNFEVLTQNKLPHNLCIRVKRVLKENVSSMCCCFFITLCYFKTTFQDPDVILCHQDHFWRVPKSQKYQYKKEKGKKWPLLKTYIYYFLVVDTASQLVILPPHIPWKGHAGVVYCFLSFLLVALAIFDLNGSGENSAQSYKAPMIVNYDSRVVIWGIFQSGTTLES